MAARGCAKACAGRPDVAPDCAPPPSEVRSEYRIEGGGRFCPDARRRGREWCSMSEDARSKVGRVPRYLDRRCDVKAKRVSTL